MCDADHIKKKVTKEHISLNMSSGKIPHPFKSIADYGLRLDAQKRDINIDQINQWLISPPNQVNIKSLNLYINVGCIYIQKPFK